MPYNDQIKALRMAGAFKAHDFYPAEFPSGVPTIALEKFSLSRLINEDKEEAAKLFETCRTTGFFYLDMLDHPRGRQLWRNACKLHQLGRQKFQETPAEEKLKYKTRPGIRVFDRG
jgi:isopenicillin N synthase-like dioxygenase